MTTPSFMNTKIQGRWKDAWKERLASFEKETGKVETAMKKKAGAKSFWDRFRKGKAKQEMSMAKAFAKMDQAYAVYGKAPAKKKDAALAAFEKAVNSAEQLGKGYLGRVTNEMKAAAPTKEMSKADIAAKQRDIDRMLKILAADIETLISWAKAIVVRNKREMKDGKKVAANPLAMKSLRAGLKANLTKSGTWLLKQDRKPNVEAFNEGVTTATRNVYMQAQLLRDTLDKSSKEHKGIVRDLKSLEDWAMYSKSLPDTAGGDHVIIAVSQIKQAFKNLAQIEKML